MPHKEPNNYSNFDWIMISIVALWAAISTFIQRELKDVSIKKRIYFGFQDVILSMGVTYLTFIGLLSYGIHDGISIALSGYAGHKAARFMFIIDKYIEKKVGIEEIKEK